MVARHSGETSQNTAVMNKDGHPVYGETNLEIVQNAVPGSGR